MTEVVETGRAGLMDAVDRNGRTIHPRDTVRDTRTGRLHEVQHLADEWLPAWRAQRGKAYRPVFLDTRGWCCPHDFTIEVSALRGVTR